MVMLSVDTGAVGEWRERVTRNGGVPVLPNADQVNPCVSRSTGSASLS